ncbi:DUF3179 domain-containing protein [bacterium]|nr:DUF3179 domain-containing protein [bacterium]
MSAALVWTAIHPAQAITLNGFDLSKTDIPANEILSGGPGRDGIPAIFRPEFDLASDAAWLAPSDRVLSIEIDSDARAYPIRILNWHEIVNDIVGGVPVVISFCPLCGTGMAFDRRAEGKPLTFGVSGLLYNSDVLMYDRETGSLWSQIMMKAVSGRMRGKTLRLLPLDQTTFADFKARYPSGKVLSTRTGHMRDYGRSPYREYAYSPLLYFPVSNRDERLQTKEPVAGIVVGGRARAYPIRWIRAGPGRFQDRIGGTVLEIEYDKDADLIRVNDSAGRPIPVVRAFWFAWAAFHPRTEIFSSGN